MLEGNWCREFECGKLNLGLTRSYRRVLVGRKVVLIPRGDRTRLMASEVPLMYGMVVEVVTVGVCEGEFRLREVWEW